MVIWKCPQGGHRTEMLPEGQRPTRPCGTHLGREYTCENCGVVTDNVSSQGPGTGFRHTVCGGKVRFSTMHCALELEQQK